MLGHQQWAGGERGPTKGRETALGLTPDGSGLNPGSERPGDFSTGRKSDLVGIGDWLFLFMDWTKVTYLCQPSSRKTRRILSLLTKGRVLEHWYYTCPVKLVFWASTILSPLHSHCGLGSWLPEDCQERQIDAMLVVVFGIHIHSHWPKDFNQFLLVDPFHFCRRKGLSSRRLMINYFIDHS